MSPPRSASLVCLLFTALAAGARADEGPELPGVELPGIETSAKDTSDPAPRESYTPPTPERSRVAPPRVMPKLDSTPVGPGSRPEPYMPEAEKPMEKPRGGFFREPLDSLRGKSRPPATTPEPPQPKQSQVPLQPSQRQQLDQRQQQLLQQQQRMRAQQLQQQPRQQPPQSQQRPNTAPPANWRRMPQGMTPKGAPPPQAKRPARPDGFEQQAPTTPWREDITPPRGGARPALPSQQPGIRPQSNGRAPANYQPASPYRAPQPAANNRTATTQRSAGRNTAR